MLCGGEREVYVTCLLLDNSGASGFYRILWQQVQRHAIVDLSSLTSIGLHETYSLTDKIHHVSRILQLFVEVIAATYLFPYRVFYCSLMQILTKYEEGMQNLLSVVIYHVIWNLNESSYGRMAGAFSSGICHAIQSFC